jgi:hypothetical protein
MTAAAPLHVQLSALAETDSMCDAAIMLVQDCY